MKDKKEKEIVRRLVDPDTGEYIDLYEGDKIVRSNQQEAIKKTIQTKKLNEEIKDWNEELGGFVFVLFKYCDKLLNSHTDITPEDITKLFYLATYVDYKGNLIFDDKSMTRQNLQEVLKINRSNFDLFFNKMKKNNIFIQPDKNTIKINKEYFTKGEIEKEIQQYYDYTRVYIKSIRYLFENVPQRKHKQLGTYFKLIPYIHRQQNVLCWNPSDNINDIQLMTLSDLKDILGYNRKSVKPFIDSLLETRLDNGEAIVGFFVTNSDFWKSTVVVNPKVFYGGNFNIDGGISAFSQYFKVKNPNNIKYLPN